MRTPEQHRALIAQALSNAAAGIGADLQRIVRELDLAHAEGIAVPSAAREAVETLTALVLAWSCNAAGQPAPPFALARLGLPSRGTWAASPTTTERKDA